MKIKKELKIKDVINIIFKPILFVVNFYLLAMFLMFHKGVMSAKDMYSTNEYGIILVLTIMCSYFCLRFLILDWQKETSLIKNIAYILGLIWVGLTFILELVPSILMLLAIVMYYFDEVREICKANTKGDE